MNMDYINAAFKELSLLTEETFDTSMRGINKLSQFIDDDTAKNTVKVIDSDAMTEDDLQSNYVGKVIINCNVCHSHIFKSKEMIELEDGVANVTEECPYCGELSGYVVVGEVVPYNDPNTDPKVTVDGEELPVDSSINEGLFDGGKKKKQMYDKAIQDVFKKNKLSVASDISNAVQGIIRSYSNIGTSAKSFYVSKSKSNANAKSTLQAMYNEIKKNPSAIFLKVTGLAIRNSIDTSDLDNLQTMQKQGLELKKVPKIGYKAYDYLMSQVQPRVLKDLEAAMKRTTESIEVSSEEEVNKHLNENDIDNRDNTVLSTPRGKLRPHTRRFLRMINQQVHEDIDQENIDQDNVTESFNNVNVETEDSILTLASEDSGKVTVTTEPKEINEEDAIEGGFGELTDETVDEIESANAPEEEIEEPVEEPTEDEVDVEVDEVAEDSVEELGESFLKSVYENVDSFHITDVSATPSKMIVEGTIKFNSGNSRKTGFIFEATSITPDGKVLFSGYNKHVCNTRDAFLLEGYITDKKLFAEKLSYKYNAKTVDGTSRLVEGFHRFSK